ASYQGQDMVLRVRVDLTTDEILDCKPYVSSMIGARYTEVSKGGKGMSFIIENGKSASDVLDRDKMLKNYSMGIRFFTYDYSIGRIGSELSWAEGVARLFESPDNSHVEMFFYAYNISKQKNEQLLIGSIINSVYEKIGIIDLPDCTFRNFIVKKEIISDHGMSYRDYIQNIEAARYIPEIDQANFLEAMNLETVKRELENQDLYTFRTPYMEMKEGGGVRMTYKMMRFFYIDDAHTGIILCVSDVTRQSEKEMAQKESLKEALVKAESANRAKSEFVSRISHDIRTPIGAIQNLTQFAKMDVDNKAKLMHDLEQIETSNKFLLSLINDVLDISKVDKGQIKLIPEVYPYREYIDNIQNIMEPMCSKKGLHWQMNIVEKGYGGAAIIDRVRMNQISLNLLSNAVKYTPECGEVTYTSKSRVLDDGSFMLAFEVKDNGIGMSEEFQKHMFEEFSQEYDNGNRPKGITGTGLGLAIVKRMVDLMGGKLIVESELGIGTCINVEIPCQFRTDSEINKAAEEEAVYEKQNEDAKINLPGKVLLAEDNPINVDIAMTFLEMFGCKVEHAENGKEAVELFAFSKPKEYSVILMDIQMPFMDGYEATKRIRALKREDAKTVPIIAMTADAFEDARQRAYDAGVDDYLTKPLNAKELKRRLLDIGT
ncbi:MAG: response regulator, partial [Treponema sp.]|nr:response regulator [Treponema sp.]